MLLVLMKPFAFPMDVEEGVNKCFSSCLLPNWKTLLQTCFNIAIMDTGDLFFFFLGSNLNGVRRCRLKVPPHTFEHSLP